MPFVEVVDIYKCRKSGVYKLQEKCRHPKGGPTDFGEPKIFTEQEMETKGVRVIVSALESSLKPCSDASQIVRRSRAEYRKFRREHSLVSVIRWSDRDGQVEIDPMRPEEGGYTNILSAKIRLQPNELPEKLIWAVREAFRRMEESEHELQ